MYHSNSPVGISITIFVLSKIDRHQTTWPIRIGFWIKYIHSLRTIVAVLRSGSTPYGECNAKYDPCCCSFRYVCRCCCCCCYWTSAPNRPYWFPCQIYPPWHPVPATHQFSSILDAIFVCSKNSNSVKKKYKRDIEWWDELRPDRSMPSLTTQKLGIWASISSITNYFLFMVVAFCFLP